ncbi:hypothetical protein ACRCP3_23390, partial [Pseudomonas aeruginosa]
SKIEQKQLNTWVSFQSAEQPLLGQFSVSGNSRNRTTGANRNCRALDNTHGCYFCRLSCLQRDKDNWHAHLLSQS